MLSSYARRAIYLPLWHKIIITMDSSSIMIDDELWYRHVWVGDIEKCGPPMTGEPNLVVQGVNRDHGLRRIGKSNWGEPNSASQGVNQDDESRPIGEPNWVGNQIGPLVDLVAYIRSKASSSATTTLFAPPPSKGERGEKEVDASWPQVLLRLRVTSRLRNSRTLPLTI